MMLRVMSENHPSNILGGLIGIGAYSQVASRKIRGNPDIVLDEGFWDYLEGVLEQHPAYIESDKRKLFFVEKLWRAQVDFVRSQEPTTLYLEGPRSTRDPVAEISRRLGYKTKNLDTLAEFTSIPQFDHPDYGVEQSKREDRWVSRILEHESVHPSKTAPLFLTGFGHARGDFGLPGKLKAEGVELELIPEFRRLCDEYDLLVEGVVGG